MLRSTVEKVTPKQAATYLKKFQVNRRLRPGMVDYLSREIIENRWQLSHQGVAFFEDGSGADGQHRLNAIVKAGKAVHIAVFRGLKKTAMNIIDTGTARTPDDVLRINGRDYGPGAGGIVKQIAFGMEGGRGRLSNQVILELADRYGMGIKAINDAFEGKSVAGITVAPVKAAMVRAFFALPQRRGKIKRFAAILLKGLDADIDKKTERPAYLLRELLIGAASVRGSQTVAEVYAKTERALHSFLNGDNLDKIYATKFELFPMPGENDDSDDTSAPVEDGKRHFLVPVSGRGGESGSKIVKHGLRIGKIRIGKNSQCRKLIQKGDRLAFICNNKVIGDASVEEFTSSPRAQDDAFPYEIKLNGTRAYYERPVEVNGNLCAKLSGFQKNPTPNMLSTLVRSIRPLTAKDFGMLTTCPK